jgi:predicted dehydrogenase
MGTTQMTNIGLIGCGYWGPNLLRNFMKIRGARVVAVADLNPARLQYVQSSYPAVEVTSSPSRVLESDEIDAVVIATPISTHYALAREALFHGKHVLLEKPMTASVSESDDLVELAHERRKVLMVDHTFIYSGAVRKLRDLIDSGQLGDIYYYDSVRINLGLFQPDVNVLWDLAPHDFSIMLHLIHKNPVAVNALGASPVVWRGWRRESIAYVAVHFSDGTIAHFHVNWLSPMKVRRTIIGGSSKMVIYDHLDPDNQVKIYDKGVRIDDNGERYKTLVQYRTGDLLAPKVDQTEALEIACKHFVQCMRTGDIPITDGAAGLRVVQLVEAAQRSMRNQGEKVELWKADKIDHYISALAPTLNSV